MRERKRQRRARAQGERADHARYVELRVSEMLALLREAEGLGARSRRIAKELQGTLRALRAVARHFRRGLS